MFMVIGANGYLGRYILKELVKNVNENIIACARRINADEKMISWETCDITNHDNINDLYDKYNAIKLKVIFLAAYQNPDKVLENPYLSWQTNITALADFIGIFKNIEKLYYASTEVVYGESQGKIFTEYDELNPVSLYGKQKKLAEQIVLSAGFNVVRFPVLYGPSLDVNKPHFYDNIINNVKNECCVEMFDDQIRNFLYVGEAAKYLVKLMQLEKAENYKIINICGDVAMSKYQLGVKIIRENSLNENYIVPINMNENNIIFKEKRAFVTLMDNRLLKSIIID